jgi:hypothetical protein
MSLKNNTFYVLSTDYKNERRLRKPIVKPKRKCVMCGPVDDGMVIINDTRVDPTLGIKLGYEGWCEECIRIDEMFDNWQWL